MKKILLIVLTLIFFSTVCGASEILDSLLIELEKTSGKEKIDILLSISHSYDTGEVDKGISYANQALDLAEEINDETLIIESKIALGQLQIRTGNFDFAEELLLEGRDYFLKTDRDSTLSLVYSNLGLLYREKGESDKSLEYYTKSLNLKSRRDDPYGYATVLQGIGLTNIDKGEYKKAQKYFLEAIEVGKLCDSETPLIYAYNNLGLVHRQLDEYDIALEYYLKALETSKELGLDLIVASAYNNIANIHYMVGDSDQAMDDLDKALQIYQSIGSKINIARTLNNLSILAKENNQHKEAIDLLERAYEIRLELGNNIEIANSLQNLASLYEDLGNYQKAIDYFSQAQEINLALGDNINTVYVISSMGYLYKKLGKYDQALEKLNEAYVLAKDLELNIYLKSITSNFASIYAVKGNYKKAYEFLQENSMIKDSLNMLNNIDKLNELRVQFETEKKEAENKILSKDLALSQFEKNSLTYILIGSFFLLAVIIGFSVTRIKVNQKLKLINKDLEIAKENAEQMREQISLVNKILRHDLTNSFSVILSALQLYKNQGEENMLDEAEKRCNTSIDLIRHMRMLEIGSKDAVEFAPVDVADLLNTIKEDYSDIQLTIHGNAQVLADKALDSVFINLLDNARNHGGATRVKVKIEKTLEFIVIKFTNNGNAIPRELKDNIFEEGITSGGKEHTGMGLFLVRQNINRFGGSILLTENKDHCVTFTINLKQAKK